MKNNEYLQKYGEKALQLYKKTHRNSQQQVDKTSHLIPKRNQSRKKSSSQKSLRNQKSKSKLNNNPQPTFTFQRIGQPKTKSKLIISGLSTPKNNIGKSCNTQQDRKISSSTKKKQVYDSISYKLKEVASRNKKSTKKMLTGVLQCMQMISQHEQKLNQWLAYIKQIICHISEQSINYRHKWKAEVIKTRKLEKQFEQMQKPIKYGVDKRSKVSQYSVLAENQRLRESIQRMQGKVRDLQRKQMILISTLQHCNLKSHCNVDKMQMQAHSNSRQPNLRNSQQPNLTYSQQPNLSCIQKQFYSGQLQGEHLPSSSSQQQQQQQSYKIGDN